VTRIPLLAAPERRWTCPNCHVTATTRRAEPHTEFHPCRGLAGLNAPMVPAGTRAKVEAVERDDYIGREMVQLDGDGRPIMAVVTTRADGQDCAVYAPCATVTREETHGYV
jgi:hypothetical protein